MARSIVLTLSAAHKIAYEYLQKSGLMEDPADCGRFLDQELQRQIALGVSSRLLMSNRAITAYLRAVEEERAEGARLIHTDRIFQSST